MDCSLPGCSVHGISQARILEWDATSFSRGSSWLRDRIHLQGDSLPLSHQGSPWQILNTKILSVGTSLVVQWLRLHTPNSKGPGLIPSQEIRSHMLQRRPRAAQTNKQTPQTQCFLWHLLPAGSGAYPRNSSISWDALTCPSLPSVIEISLSAPTFYSHLHLLKPFSPSRLRSEPTFH